MSDLEDKIINFSIWLVSLVAVILFVVVVWDGLHGKHHSDADAMVSCHNILVGNHILNQCIPIPVSH